MLPTLRSMKKYSVVFVLLTVFIICAVCASVLPDYCFSKSYNNGLCDLNSMDYANQKGLNTNGQWLFFTPLIIILVYIGCYLLKSF